MAIFNATGHWFLLLILGVGLVKKIIDFRGFQDAIRGYLLLPEGLIWPVAAVFVTIELALVSLGLVNFPFFGYAAAILFFTYSVIILVSFNINGENFDCGCALISTHEALPSPHIPSPYIPSPYIFVLRNAALVMIAVFVSMTFVGTADEISGLMSYERVLIALTSAFFTCAYFVVEHLISIAPAVSALSLKNQLTHEGSNVHI